VRAAAHPSRLRPYGLAQAAAFVVVLVVLPIAFPAQWLVNLFIFTAMFAGAAMAWNLIGGYAGYPALGNGAFFGIGAYAMAILTTHLGVGGGYWTFAWAIPIAIGTAIVFAPIARLLLRTRAAVFAILTITLLFIGQTLAYNLVSLTQGSLGMTLPSPSFPAARYDQPFYYAMAGLLALTVLFCWAVRNSKVGLALNAVRDDEDRARGLGVQTEMVKLFAYCSSAGLTAAFGAIWAYYISFVFPGFAFDPILSLSVILFAFLGGVGSLWGPVVGAVLIVPVQQYLAFRFGASHLYLIAYAAVFLLVIYLLPNGIVPSGRQYLTRLWRLRSGPTAPDASLLVSSVTARDSR
jgi:branched-chain amino acid transport system permease protein